MKKLLFALAAIAAFSTVSAQHLGTEYRLKKIVEVPGRQGIAADENYYYVSDTRGLYKFDKNWNLVKKHVQTPETPLFPNPELANHFGDIDVWNGKIYTGNEKFEYGRGYNIAISVYDAETLEWIEDIPWCAESGQVEVSGLAVDREKNMIWMSDWVDSRSYTVTASKRASTTPKSNDLRSRNGATAFKSPTARCTSLPTTGNRHIRFQTLSMSPTSPKSPIRD